MKFIKCQRVNTRLFRMAISLVLIVMTSGIVIFGSNGAKNRKQPEPISENSTYVYAANIQHSRLFNVIDSLYTVAKQIYPDYNWKRLKTRNLKLGYALNPCDSLPYLDPCDKHRMDYSSEISEDDLRNLMAGKPVSRDIVVSLWTTSKPISDNYGFREYVLQYKSIWYTLNKKEIKILKKWMKFKFAKSIIYYNNDFFNPRINVDFIYRTSGQTDDYMIEYFKGDCLTFR